MVTLLGKQCYLNPVIYSLPYFEPINLICKTEHGYMFNTIEIREAWSSDGSPFSSLMFGNSHEMAVSMNHGTNDYIINQNSEAEFMRFTIIGGTDVDNPIVINIMYQMCQYIMCSPNNSSESLDNQVIEFNPTLTELPNIEEGYYGWLYGAFKIRCSTSEGIEHYIACNCIDFSDTRYLSFWTPGGLSYDYKQRAWFMNGETRIKAPVFEDFKFTGLENSETFMKWLSENAKISLKKNKDKKRKTPKSLHGSNLSITSSSKSCLALGYDGFLCNGIINGKYLINTIRVSNNYIHFDALYKVEIGETGDGGALPGTYEISIICSDDTIQYFRNDGFNMALDFPLTIEGFSCPLLNEDSDFIEYIISNTDVTSIKDAIIKFKPTLSDWPLPRPTDFTAVEFIGSALISCDLNGEKEVRVSDGIRIHYNNDIPYELHFMCTRGKSLAYFFNEAKWKGLNVGDENTLENVIINYFDYPELNENPKLISWVYENAEDVCFTKGSNTIDELLTNISDVIRFKTKNDSKIHAQDMTSGILTISPTLQEKTVTKNGEVTPDEGYDGLSKVTVEVKSDGEEWFNDGNTHLWIHLPELYTSPMVGVCPNGTVTVDWGDGTTPDVLTGTSTSEIKYTPNHNYAKAGAYVITLTVDGEMGIIHEYYGWPALLVHTSDYDNRSFAYYNALRKAEIGSAVTKIGDNAFNGHSSLASISIGNGVTEISPYTFSYCGSLTSITIPNSVTKIGGSAFEECHALASVSIGNNVTEIGDNAFVNCHPLANITIPNSVTKIGTNAFNGCDSLTSVTIPNSVTEIGSGAFGVCPTVLFYDFTQHTIVPTLGGGAFDNIENYCQIRVPMALLDEWKAAENWSEYASYIVGV